MKVLKNSRNLIANISIRDRIPSSITRSRNLPLTYFCVSLVHNVEVTTGFYAI